MTAIPLIERLESLGISLWDVNVRAMITRGWVLVVDERDGGRRVSVFPPDITAWVIQPNNL